jgi:hypothetical protein
MAGREGTGAAAVFSRYRKERDRSFFIACGNLDLDLNPKLCGAFLSSHPLAFCHPFYYPIATMTKKDQEVESPPSQQNNKVHWSKLEEVEKEGRPPFLLTMPEIKLLGIAGVCPLVSVFIF